ncbi:TPA: hypothetical protein P2N00_001576 [Aeromonas salmonicida]|uniref:Uncharacterized protein n=2 Tax=Aeromonas salmonicida subsp. salmonicida TaxID=29491 RepID=A4SL76_AERS4|nr:DUF1420 family protein [Aeromonas salmonicida]ABO89648.1 hypothetical protein ASA_1563 [Aeromonas salmonicida subsp. salmonicida A449]AYO62736.1 hypothetical protein C5P03_07880 [Aeromonas salmonicida subsp. salmonicida 01-B526]EHI50638.1 hypothetical protein IYQ_20475 [Aeromonas salmonicida subsp. salmonicida 01-B526]EKP0239940.1 hypothetical protein [Aeromonas salmonicida]EKP0244123.1 hypothetical protein [Aeromonas salmonicida]
MIHIIRLIIAAAFIWFGFEQVSDDLYATLSNGSASFRVSGIANIWASYCAPLVGIVLIPHVLMSVAKIGNPDKLFQRSVLIVIFAIAPILTFATKIKLSFKSDNYVECQDLRRVSRWNSYQVYAVSVNECQLLKDRKNSK